MAREHQMIEPFVDDQVRQGVISYGVYLTHESLIDELIRRGALIPSHSETVRLLLAASVASIVAATLIHLLVERPALQLKHRLG